MRVFDPQPIEPYDLARPRELSVLLQDFDQPVRLTLGELQVQLGRAQRVGQRVQRRRSVGSFAQDFEQARPAVLRVVESIPAFDEEHVTAHLAREQGAALLQPGLDERMAGLPHAGRAAMLADPRREVARALHVVDDLGARLARQHVLREQHQLPVGIDDAAVRRDHAEPVAVAVEGESQFGPLPAHRGDEVAEVLRLRGIGVMVGEAAVDVAVELDDLAAEPAIEFPRGRAGDAVAAIDRDLHRAREARIRNDAQQVGLAHIGTAVPPRSAGEIPFFDAAPQALDVFAGERDAVEHHLQAVVLGGIVAAGHGDCAAAAQFVRGEIGDRRGAHPDLCNVDPACAQAGHQRRGELRAGVAPIAPDGDFHRADALAARAQLAAERAADELDAFRGQRLADNAADVVGLEDFLGRKIHFELSFRAAIISSATRRVPAAPPGRRIFQTAAGRERQSRLFSLKEAI